MQTMAILFYTLFWIVIAIILIYLIIRRVQLKEKENFEERDN